MTAVLLFALALGTAWIAQFASAGSGAADWIIDTIAGLPARVRDARNERRWYAELKAKQAA